MARSDLAEQRADFDPVLSMALADSWWDLGKKLAPFTAGSATTEQQTAFLRGWAAEVRDDEDPDVVAAVTPDRLQLFVATVLTLLERKFEGGDIAEDVRALIADARFDVCDDGRRLRMTETPEAFWAWEYVYLFTEMHSTSKSDWTTAVGRCSECNVFFVKTRTDQRFHGDACRKRAANVRFYRNSKAKRKRRRK